MKRILLVVSILLLIAAPAWAKTVYVSTSGSNANSCTTASDASGLTQSNDKLTLSGVQGGIACLVAGDTLLVRSGTYADKISSLDQTIPSGTSISNQITIAAYPAETVTLNKNSSGSIEIYPPTTYLTIDGFVVDGVNYTGGNDQTCIGQGGIQGTGDGTGVDIARGVSFITIKNLTIKRWSGTGLDVFNNHASSGGYISTHDITIQNTLIDMAGNSNLAGRAVGIYSSGTNVTYDHIKVMNAPGSGIQISSSYPSPDVPVNNTVRASVFTANGMTGCQNQTPGINLNTGSGHKVFNNAVYAQTGAKNPTGILMQGGSSLVVTNNDVYNTAGNGIQIGPSVSTITVSNNIVQTTGGITLSGAAPSGFTCATNIVYNGGSAAAGCTGTITTDPKFVSTSTPDFSLQATSPAIDAGTVIESASYNSCAACKNGTLPDIGAFEIPTLPVSSAAVANATPNVANITLTNNAFPPIAGCTATDFVVTVAGTGRTPSSSCVVTGSNRVDITFPGAAVTSGQAVTLAYTAGALRDSANIGNLGWYQKMLSVAAGYVVTNNVSVTAPTLTQLHSWCESWSGPEVATFHTGLDLNTGATSQCVVPVGGCVRVRMSVEAAVANAGLSGYPTYAQKNGSGGYAAVTNTNSTTGLFFAAGATLPPQVPTSIATTQQISSPDTFVAGGIALQSADIPSVAIASGSSTEIVPALCVGTATVAGDYFELHLYKSGGVALDAYTVTPRIIVGNARAVWR